MKLYGSQASPFVRKVRVVAAELGIADRLPLVTLDPHAAPPELLDANPLSKVPVLVTDDGAVLHDSAVIAEWLDVTFGPKLIPAVGPARWQVLTTAALADGMQDAGGLVRFERLRPEAERSAAWIAKHTAKFIRGLDRLDVDPSWRDGPDVDLGKIAVGCFLGWIAFRMPELRALDTRPALAGWYAGFAARPSMQSTAPA